MRGSRFTVSASRRCSRAQEEVVDYGPPLEKFELTQSTGDKFKSDSLDGQVWVANFFYSTCPSICVQENLKVQELERQFADRGVKFVSITCDAPNDTPSRLRDYSERFNAKPDRWVFLTGDQKYIERIGSDIFKVPMSRRYHSERLFVVDRKGELRRSVRIRTPRRDGKNAGQVERTTGRESAGENGTGQFSSTGK